jgi:hypothetical protein
MAWGFLSGVILYFFCFGAASGIISESGITNDYWNSGMLLFFTLIVTHHCVIFGETRQYTVKTVIMYVESMAFMLLTIWLCDSGKNPRNVYFKDQFSIMLKSPLFYLTSGITAFVLVIPRYLMRKYE